VENRIERSFYVDLFLMLANSDRRQITAREIEERHEEKMLMLGPVLQRLNDELLAMPEGRRVLWDIVGRCNIFQAITVTNASMYMMQGAKNIGLGVIDDIERIDPDAFIKMMREGKSRAQEDEEYIARLNEELGDDS